jgi:hypothetical protein
LALELETLRYLAERLARIADQDCMEAHRLVSLAMADHPRIAFDTAAQLELFELAHRSVTRSMHRALHSPEHARDVEALEVELLGRMAAILVSTSRRFRGRENSLADILSRFSRGHGPAH